MLIMFLGFLVIGISSSQFAFADPGQVINRGSDLETTDNAVAHSLELVEPQPIGVTFFGHGGYSADAIGTTSHSGIVSADVPPGSTVQQAYVYVTKYGSCTASNSINFDGQSVTVDKIGNASWGGCAYRADVTSQVSAKIGSGSGITDFNTNYNSASSADGVVLVVIYSNPSSPEVSIAVLDGAQNSAGDTFLLGLAKPLDKTVPGFFATMSLGIGFSYQGVNGHVCGGGQASTIDINGQRLTSCAGNYDDGQGANGALITVGGIGDNTNNPPNPNGSGGEDDELYNISDFLNNGDTQIIVNTQNPSNDDIIFLSIIEITAQASVGEICGDKIDNDEDGLIDEGCQVEEPPTTCVDYNFNDLEIQEFNTLAFNSDPSNWSGFVSYESVQGFTADGFDGLFLRNPSVPAQKTTLTLTDLPEHTSLDLGFLLAVIDSWDGSANNQYAPDVFNVDVDGQSIFSETFESAFGPASYVPPEGAEIAFKQPRGFNGSWLDSSYNMANDPTFQNINHTSSSVTIDFYASGNGWQGGNDESWAIDNVQVCINAPEPEVRTKNAGDNQWDTRPTFGISHEDRQNQVVENGFRFNNNEFTLTDNHWTPFEEQSVEIGTVNSFSATVYADKQLKIQEFLFGIPKVGEAEKAELGVEVWYDFNGEIQDVKVVQKSNVIDSDTISVSHEKVKCLSTDSEEKCDNTTVSMKFLEPLKDKVMAIKAIDFKNRDQRTFLNEGFDISGASLNPMLSKMIPSNTRDAGLIQVTQIEKYSPYWVTDDGRIFEMNSFGSFKQINQKFERFQDKGNAFTRMHSGFGEILNYEKNRATQVFDATKLISELPDSFGYHFEMKERMSDEIKQNMLQQEQIAKGILEQMDKQNRHY